MQPSGSLYWAGIIAASLLTATVEAGGGRRTATVRVYCVAGAATPDRPSALSFADAVLSPGGVDVQWRDCAARPEDCAGPTTAGEFVIRLQPGPRVAHVWAEMPLGSAVVVPHEQMGVFATVYTDRVDRKAREAGMETHVLLGLALAHELGHLLLGTTAHTPSGLMRAVWTKAELRRNRPDDWMFTTRNIAEITGRRAP